MIYVIYCEKCKNYSIPIYKIIEGKTRTFCSYCEEPHGELHLSQLLKLAKLGIVVQPELS